MAFALISALCRLRQDNQKLKIILIYTNKQIIKQTVHTQAEWKQKEISKMKKKSQMSLYYFQCDLIQIKKIKSTH